MDMSEYVETLNRELANITRFAREDVAQAAQLLTDAMESSVRLTLLEVLSAAADEITTRLDDTVIDVRLSGSDADFVVTVVEPEPEPGPEPAPAEAGDASEGMARVTLRISEPLTARVARAAAAAGISVNAWLVRAVSQALDAPAGRTGRGSPGAGQRFTGYARS
jgi:hypothetical protein